MNKLDQDENLQLEEVLQELRLSTIRGDLNAVQTALDKGALSVDQRLKGGWTALMYACSLGHQQLVKYFLEKGANPNFHKELYSPLMAVCASSQPDQDRLAHCVDLLLAHGANINMADRHQMTALMFAAKEGHTKLVARLTDMTATHCNVNAQDSHGWTALFWAVNKGRSDIVKILISKGARVDIKDRSGSTAARLAQNKQLIAITDLLNRNHTRPPDVKRNFIQAPNPPERKTKNVIGQKPKPMLEDLLDELSTNNNNDRYSNSLPNFIKRMELENNIEALKVLSNIVNSVNGCLQKSIVPVNGYSKRADDKENVSIEMNWRNIPYSAVEAREALTHIVRQLDAMYATMSYVRLRMQGNPPAAMLEDKYSRIGEVSILSDKALHFSRLLHDEVKFFRKYTRQLEERHPVPADFVIEQKTDNSNTKIISSCVIAAAIVVVLFNSRVFKLPFSL